MRTYFVSYAVNGYLGNFVFDVKYRIKSSGDILELQRMIEDSNKFDTGSVVVINVQRLQWQFGRK